MRVFHLRRNQTGKAIVEVEENNEQYPLVHVGNHSPDGFNWGYSGSGSTDLAWSMLACHLGESNLSNLEQKTGCFLSQKLHQTFKEEVIARIPYEKDVWVIYEIELIMWLANHDWTAPRLEEYRKLRDQYREDNRLYSKLEIELEEDPKRADGVDKEEWDAKHSEWNAAFQHIIDYEKWLQKETA